MKQNIHLIELPEDGVEYPQIPGYLLIKVTREPYDDSYSIFLPNGDEEYVLPDKAERLLRLHGIKDPEKILTHVHNFYESVIYIDDPTYKRTENGKQP